MLQLALRFRHGCKVSRLSARHPEAVMAHWCNYRVEVLEVRSRGRSDPAQFEADLVEMWKDHEVLSRTPAEGNVQTVMLACPHRPGRNIDDLIEGAGCLALYPVLYEAGWEHYRILAPDEARARAVVAALKTKGEVEVAGKRRSAGDLTAPAFMVPAGELLAGLTEKQASALALAIRHGYYRVPRKVRTEDIARARKVPRTTFEEHVRKAESKIMASMAPYVALFANPPP